MSLETRVELLEVLRILLAAAPMCWIRLRMAPRNWLNQLASCAVSSRPRISRLRVRSPSPWAMSSRPLVTLLIGRTISLAKVAPTTANSAASTKATTPISQVRRVVVCITSLCSIRPMKVQPSCSSG
ncbi:hypothetical protein D3C77_536950 [compost metagenome]